MTWHSEHNPHREYEPIDFSDIGKYDYSKVAYQPNENNFMTTDTLTGTWIALAGIVVSVLGHFNIMVAQDSVVAIIAGAVALYGVIHQLVISKKATGSLK